MTDIQRSARWFYRNKNWLGGADLNSYGISALVPVGSCATRMEAIRALSLRLDRVVIEHLDWSHCLRLYDRPSTFFFIDPPYTSGKVGMYEG